MSVQKIIYKPDWEFGSGGGWGMGWVEVGEIVVVAGGSAGLAGAGKRLG